MSGNYDLDIVLHKITNFQNHMAPICVQLNKDSVVPDRQGLNCTLVGWSLIQSGKRIQRLKSSLVKDSLLTHSNNGFED